MSICDCCYRFYLTLVMCMQERRELLLGRVKVKVRITSSKRNWKREKESMLKFFLFNGSAPDSEKDSEKDSGYRVRGGLRARQRQWAKVN
jgi:hypothetical protein